MHLIEPLETELFLENWPSQTWGKADGNWAS